MKPTSRSMGLATSGLCLWSVSFMAHNVCPRAPKRPVVTQQCRRTTKGLLSRATEGKNLVPRDSVTTTANPFKTLQYIYRSPLYYSSGCAALVSFLAASAFHQAKPHHDIRRASQSGGQLRHLNYHNCLTALTQQHQISHQLIMTK
jgi:hypothetical protein